MIRVWGDLAFVTVKLCTACPEVGELLAAVGSLVYTIGLRGGGFWI